MIIKKPIKLPRINLVDFVSCFRADLIDDTKYLMNIRGISGSGKSTFPQMLINQEPNPILLVTENNLNKESVWATYLPSFNIAVCGKYFSKPAGLDTLKTNEKTMFPLRLLWESGVNIIAEGVISSSILWPYFNFFRQLKEKNKKRHLVIFFLTPPLNVCIDRIKSRNKNEEFNIKRLEARYRSVISAQTAFNNDNNFTVITADNSTIQKEETIGWYKKLLKNEGIDLY